MAYELSSKERKQVERISQGSRLVESIAGASLQLRKVNTHLPGDFRYRSHEEFFLKHGRLYRPRPFPKRYRLLRGKPQACLYNALLLAVLYELDYVEGYALNADVRISQPVEHAWCVDARGNVIDPTWHEAVGREYFGVALDRWLLTEQHQSGKPFGLMFNDELFTKVARGKARGWRKMLAVRGGSPRSAKKPP